MAISPRTRVNLSDKIRAALEAEITSGQLVAGARIDEQELMERFEVSRTPAREALLQLISAGLVTTVPRHGAVVATLSVAEYVAMLEVLSEMEGLAARLSARRMPAAQRRLLQEADQACRLAAQSDDAAAYGSANTRFHEIIYDGSLNEVLARQLRAMRLRMRHPRSTLFDRPGRIRHSLAEHDKVLQAILAGDEDGAYRAMTGHISSGGNVYADAIASMPFAHAAPAPLAVAATSMSMSTVSASASAEPADAPPLARKAVAPRRVTSKPDSNAT